MNQFLDKPLTSPGFDDVVKLALAALCFVLTVRCIERGDWLMTSILAGSVYTIFSGLRRDWRGRHSLEVHR
jgi:hypothetical protein